MAVLSVHFLYSLIILKERNNFTSMDCGFYIAKKSLPTHSRCSSVIISKVLCFTYICKMVCVDFCIMYEVRKNVHFSGHMDICVSNIFFFFFENTILSPLNCFLILVLAKNQCVGLFLDTLLCNTERLCVSFPH